MEPCPEPDSDLPFGMPDITFSYKKDEFACAMSKVDRSKLYGSVDHEVVDEHDQPCKLVTIGSDGMTLIPSGGTAFGYLSSDGEWREKSSLTAVNLDGDPIVPVTSTLKETVPLDTSVTIEEYLTYAIRLVYDLDQEALPDNAKAELAKGTIFQFPFSYRGGLEADAAFLFAGSKNELWMVVGNPTQLHFIGLEQSTAEADDSDSEDEDDEDELMDFGFM